MASSNSSGQLEFNREIKIPVPWGHIAAKIWGADGGLPVLAIHGWMDNAGSFDRLAPLLPPHIQLVCIDLCGQGQSSHFPPGKFVMYHDYVYHVKLVIDYFKWKRIVIMGHSLGSLIVLLFTSMFPELVEKVITLERTSYLSTPPLETLLSKFKNSLSKFQELSAKLELGTKQPPMTYVEARTRIVRNYRGSVDEKDADVLLIRGLRKRSEKDEWEFTRDPRCNIEPILFFHLTKEQLKAVARVITCPYLHIVARDNHFKDTETHSELYEVFRRTSEDFRMVEVEGRHHVHLSNPEVVAPHVYNFLLPFKASKL